MAQKRLLDRKITTSERVNDLSLLAIIIYTWAIPVTDDFGLLQGSPRTIKAQVVPMLDITAAQVEECISEIINLNLWQEFFYQEKKYYKFCGFEENQRLRKDLQPFTILPIKLEIGQTKEIYARNWKACNTLVTDLLQTRNGLVPHLDTELKVIEGNRREGKVIENTLSNKLDKAVLQTDEKLVFGNVDVNAAMEILTKKFEVVPKVKENRRFINHLFRRKGINRTLKAMIFSLEHLDEPYFPKISSYKDLWDKWNDLEVFARRKVNGVKSVDAGAILGSEVGNAS